MKVGVFGASGRMGQELVVVGADMKVTPWLGVYRSKAAEGYHNQTQDLQSPLFEQVNVMIDFSMPETISEVVASAAKYQKPLVSGVTGIGDAEINQLRGLAAQVPVLWSPNFSLGINLFKNLISSCAKLEGFDFQIEESHHRHKKDAPSGTAKLLQQELLKSLSKQKRKAPEPLAIRGGGIVGDHKLHIMSDYETLTIEHRALNRKVFAAGALKVSQWMEGRSPGFYTMDDYFGL